MGHLRWFVLAGLLLAACGGSSNTGGRVVATIGAPTIATPVASPTAAAPAGNTGNPNAVATSVAQTAAARLGQTAFGTSVPVSAPTLSPTTAPTATPAAKSGDTLYQADWSNGLNGWSGSTTGWNTVSGMLVFNGKNGAENWIAAPLQLNGRADYAVEATIQVVKTDYGYDGFGLVLRADGQKGYLAGVSPQGKVALVAPLNNFENYNLVRIIAKEKYDPKLTAHIYRAEVKGNSVRLLIDGAVVVNATDNLFLSPGKVGLDATGCQLSILSFKVIAL